MSGLWQQNETKLMNSITVTMNKFVNNELDEDKFIISPPKPTIEGSISLQDSLQYIRDCQDKVDQLTSLCALIDAAYTWYNYKYERLKDLHIGALPKQVEEAIDSEENKKPKVVRTNAEQRKAIALSDKEVESAGNAMIAAFTLKVYLEKHKGAAQNRLVSAWNLNKSIRQSDS